MDQQEIIAQIKQQAGLSSRQDATEALRAALELVGERAPEDLSADLAASLPAPIARYVQPPVMVAAGGGERFDRREFVHNVAERCHLTDTQAAAVLPAVFGVLGQATSPRLIDQVCSALPGEMRSLVTPSWGASWSGPDAGTGPLM